MSGHPKSGSRSDQRVVRVFVSSTFRDMQAEREELVKRIFPELRKVCESRGVRWGEVDLRWGVTDEQRAEGKVLPVCLAEIQNCRPYFLGLLGERYGWVPDAIPPDLIEREPWLADHRNRSVTELEILHGVLNNPAMADHAFFYFRDPAFLDSLPAEQRLGFCEATAPEEIARLGAAEAERRAADRRAKLAALKDRIRSSGLPVRENYPNPESLGQWVLRDLRAVIDRCYPERTPPDPLDRELAEHEAFREKLSRVYVGGDAYFEPLDRYLVTGGPPLVVVGESGSGKSALLANWVGCCRAAHPETVIVTHFVGSTPSSADWKAMVCRVMGELKRHVGLDQAIPDDAHELRTSFAAWLHLAAARHPIVVCLDGLNQLDDLEGALELIWLPREIPANLRMIASTLPGPSLDELARRRWSLLPIQPLGRAEREALVREYLAQFTKTLSPLLAERLCAAPQTANPLYLRILLEELRIWGDPATLGRLIEDHLRATTVSELFQRVLERCEGDYDRERSHLIRDLMASVWAARRGLSEPELAELLGSPREPLPIAYWSPVLLSLDASLLRSAGLIGFAHDYLRLAVRDRYLPTAAAQQAAHEGLANYFESLELGVRKVEELPWQLAKAAAWDRLMRVLRDPSFVSFQWTARLGELKTYWTQVENNSSMRMVDAYRAVLNAPAEYGETALPVSLLLADTGYLEEAITLQDYLVEHSQRSGDLDHLAGSLGNLAAMLYRRGQLDVAMALFKKEERLCRETGNRRMRAGALGNQALILCARGDFQGAMALHQEEEAICRELKDHRGLQRTLGNQASMLLAKGDVDGAMRLHEEEERICRGLGDQDQLARCLGNQALVLRQRGDLERALELFEDAKAVHRQLGDQEGLQKTLGNQALVHRDRGELGTAMELWKEQERICNQIGNPASLARALANQGSLWYQMGQPTKALPLLEQAYEVVSRHGLTDLADQIGSVLGFVRSSGSPP